ncbi:MAG: HAD family hydrolase [Magnetococcus sp. DMHC-6]
MITPIKRPAVFLDRDGVLNKDVDFLHHPAQFQWITGAKEAIRLLNQRGYLVIVVTNQSGIARGFFDEATVIALHQWIQAQLAQHQAWVDGWYYCPHHPTAGIGPYLTSCFCRKPNPGMILQAIQEWEIDPSVSFLIGDQPRDCQAAVAAHIPGYLFDGDDLCLFVEKILATI